VPPEVHSRKPRGGPNQSGPSAFPSPDSSQLDLLAPSQSRSACSISVSMRPVPVSRTRPRASDNELTLAARPFASRQRRIKTSRAHTPQSCPSGPLGAHPKGRQMTWDAICVCACRHDCAHFAPQLEPKLARFAPASLYLCLSVSLFLARPACSKVGSLSSQREAGEKWRSHALLWLHYVAPLLSLWRTVPSRALKLKLALQLALATCESPVRQAKNK